MAKVFDSAEARFCAHLFEVFGSQASGGPMFAMMLSSVKNLIKMIDSSENSQGKVREIMGHICDSWPQWEEMEGTDAAREKLSCDSE